MLDISKAKKWLKKLFTGDLKVKLIVGAGLVGMILILLAQLTSSGEKRSRETPQDPTTAEFTTQEYGNYLEEKLQNLIANVNGVGRVEVMVTLENGVEYIYAQEEKSSVDRSTQPGTGEQEGKVDYKHETQNSYVFVEQGYGEKQPLLKTELPPKVQGVVVVCEGADNVRVEQSVISVVTTALQIPTTRVCVVKINPN